MTSQDRTEPLEILVVDDEADARDLLGEFCTAQGFRVALAPDGRAAVAALERATPPFPIVIADLPAGRRLCGTRCRARLLRARLSGELAILSFQRHASLASRSTMGR
jgi:DNA-binding response OmpR family regulator